MKPVADQLLEQVTQAQRVAYQILEKSDLNFAGINYAFATADTLVIHCKDYAATLRFDQDHARLRQAIDQLNLSIHTIVLESAEQALYYWG
jgi:hypothetical protein